MTELVSLRADFWRETLVQYTYGRDFGCVVLLTHVLHVGLNTIAASSGSDCYYLKDWSLSLSAIAALCYLASLLQRSSGAWSVVADLVGLPVGVLLQVSTKPDGWFGAAPDLGCDLLDSPLAEVTFLAGELMSFPVFLRVLLWMFTYFRTPLARTLLVVSLLGAAAATAVGIHALTEAVA